MGELDIAQIYASNAKSAQPCGCDEGANYKCRECRRKQDLNLTSRVVSAMLALPGATGATRASILPAGASERKRYPIASGFMDYFPDAIAAIANLSFIGNEQHNPGKPLHWDRTKSSDESDTMQRHFLQRGTYDSDGVRHTVKMAWRALAILQKELESELVTKESV